MFFFQGSPLWRAASSLSTACVLLACLLTTTSCKAASSPPTMAECMDNFASFRFDIADFDLYDHYFRDDSVMILSETGLYQGAEGIEEHVRFATDSSPYFKESRAGIANKLRFKSVDEQGRCKFMIYRTTRYEMEPAFAREASLLAGVMLEITFDYHEQYIPNVYLFYHKKFVDYFFGIILNTHQTRKFVCDVSQNSCPNTNVGISHEECIERLEELPLVTNGRSADGNDFSCRALHATFAKKNKNHCAHISFEPQEDPNGKVKCHKSSNYDPNDIFDAKDLQDFQNWIDSPDSLIDNAGGYKILYMPEPTSRSRTIVMGLVVPFAIAVVAWIVLGCTTKGQNEDNSQDGFDEARRRGWVLFFVMASVLIVVNVVVASFVGLVVPLFREDWAQFEPYKASELADNYRGELSVAGDTTPHAQMDDDEFRVYTGFVVWVTCLIAGFGLEAFVFTRFLGVWNEDRELMWAFVQFVFPLLALTSLGLALHNDFWCLVILVLGIWKFGFPECLMYLYLGLFSFNHSKIRKATDLLNGVGILIHHGAASMIVVMICVGVIPFSRFAINCNLVLAVQHWFALLVYDRNKRLYVVVELVLEYYFEWIILSDFAEIYHLHWTAAWGAAVMLVAHWCYFIAGLLEMFDEPIKSSNRKHSGNALGRHNSVHSRGNATIFGSTNDALSASETTPVVPTDAAEEVEDVTEHAHNLRRRRVANTGFAGRNSIKSLASSFLEDHHVEVSYGSDPSSEIMLMQNNDRKGSGRCSTNPFIQDRNGEVSAILGDGESEEIVFQAVNEPVENGEKDHMVVVEEEEC